MQILHANVTHVFREETEKAALYPYPFGGDERSGTRFWIVLECYVFEHATGSWKIVGVKISQLDFTHAGVLQIFQYRFATEWPPCTQYGHSNKKNDAYREQSDLDGFQ
jgi:hypothetical protein